MSSLRPELVAAQIIKNREAKIEWLEAEVARLRAALERIVDTKNRPDILRDIARAALNGEKE